MTITLARGDLLASKAQTVVNTVNCRGVMGKGLALEFAARYPDMVQEYRALCADHKLRPGILHLYTESKPWIINFPTKDHWRFPSRLRFIEDGLRYFVAHYAEWGIESVAFPQLGCGNGGLDWADVEPIMRQCLEPLPIQVEFVVSADIAASADILLISPADSVLLSILNTSNPLEIQRQLGVGKKMSNAVVLWREQHGPFHSAHQLMTIPGFGAKRLAQLRMKAVRQFGSAQLNSLQGIEQASLL